ncbi:MAG TPA: prepilin-type N-terminal cleavage/methylation domain-containing protein [Anaeromyxobacter sp.]
MKAPGARQRGFTLIELVMAIALTSLLIAAAVTLLVNQQRAYEVGSGDRGLQEAGQTALIAIGDRIRAAGYGIDPAYAFDFGDVDRVPQQGLLSPQRLTHFQSYACGAPVRCRDQKIGALGSGTDELVFLSRNPMFSRPVLAASPAQITVRGELSRPLLRGQILQVMCLGGNRTRAYVTVANAVPAAATPDPAKDVTIPLVSGVVTGGLTTFPFQNDQLADGCFSSGTAVLAKIDRHRFYVTAFTETGIEVPIETAGARPFLMDDPGLTNPNGSAVVAAVAQDVEDLQLTYFFPQAFAGGPIQPVGATPGTNIADDAPAVTVAVPPPAIDDAPGAASRTTGSPANLVAIRVSVVVRSPAFDSTLVYDVQRTLPAAGNHAASLGVPGHRRALFEETFAIPNLRSASVVYCAIGTGPGMNRGGC